MIFKTITDETTLSGQKIVGTLQARKIAQQQATAQLEIDIACLKEYQVACQNGIVTTEQFDTIMHKASASAVEYSAKVKAGTGTAQSYANAQRATNSALQEVSIGAGIASKAVKLFSAALNMIAFTAIIQGISWLLGKVDEWIVTTKEAKESADAFKQSLSTFFNETQTNLKTISSLSDRFNELSKNVDDTGKKIGGTEEEYAEFLDICQQVGQIMPELITGYTNEGEAIITLQGKVDSLTDSYKEAIRTKAALFLSNGDEEGNSIKSFFEDYNDFVNGYQGVLGLRISPSGQNTAEEFEEYYGYDKIHGWLSNVTDATLEDLEKLRAGTTEYVYLGRVLKEAGYEISEISADNYNAVHDVFNSRMSVMEKGIADRVTNIRTAFQNMLYADSDYWKINDENVISAINSLYGSIDAEFIKNNELFSPKALQTFESNFISLFNNDATKQAMVDFYTPIADDEAVKDYADRIKSSLGTVQSYCDGNGITVPINFDDSEQTINDLEAQYQRAVDFAKDKFDGYDPTAFFKEHSINTQEEIDAWQEIAQGARDAAEAEKEYIQDSTLNKNPISFDISTYKDQIDDFQSQVKTLGDALSSIRSGNFKDSDLTDLLQEFPELMDKSDDLEAAIVELINNSLKVLYDTLGDKVPNGLKTSLQELTDLASGTAMHLGDAFSSIHSSWDVLQDFKDTLSSGFDDNITDSLLQSVRGLSGELETLVAGYYSGIVTAEELYEALTIHYESDLHNYSEALIKKNELNEGFYNAVGLASEKVTNQFMDDYDISLKNCKTYNEAKLEIEKQTLEQISGAWSQYYDAQAKTLKISMSEIEARAAHGGSDAAAFLEQYELIEKYEAAIKALNDITYNGIKSNFESISSKWDTNSSSSTKEYSEELNWIEKLINRVSTALDKLKDKVSNTYIGWSVRNHSLTKAMEKTNEAISVQQQAYEKYMQKAASVGLSQEYVNKIQNGSLNIEDITDESLADRIKEYETWYDKATDCSDAIEELKTQLADMAKQKFDNINTYFEGLMETTEKSISKLETKEKNTYKAPNVRVYNGLYDETQNLINYNTQRVQQLEEALDSAVNSGYIEAGSEAWRDMYNVILDVRNATEEYKLELQDISKRSYEALLKPIEQELARLEQRKNIIENMQDRLALQGYVEAKGLYERQLRDNESRLQTLKDQASLLQQNMADALSKGMEVGSDDWIDMKSAIDDNVISIMDLENSMIELNNAIRDLEWDKFDRLQKSISRITGESDFMIGMYGKDDIYDKDGKLTSEGSAVIGLHAQNYFAYKEQAKTYKDEIDKINKDLEADPTNTTLIDRKNDLIDAYQNATKAAYDEYEAVIELGKDGYQAQIDSIQELIDAKKKQLEADKSLYEYQKNIAEKTKNIADIQKQLSALSNDDSEESKAKIQKLKVDLENAQKDLEDTQYDKWYNDQQDMLDRLAEEYASLISEQSQNEQEIFQEMIEYVNANAQEIQDTISSTATEWGYVFNHGIDSVLEPGINGITDIGQNIYDEIQRLYKLNERMYKVSSDLADLGVTDYGVETTISDETTARNFIERLYNGLLGRQSDEDGLNFWMNKLMNGATVQDMLEGFLNSGEYKAMNKSPEDTILDFYKGLLGRPAEATEYQYWMDKYNNGMSLSEIGTHGFLDSDEFLSRDFWMGLLDGKPISHGIGLASIDLNSFLYPGLMSQVSPDYSNIPNFTRSGNNSFGDININIPIDHVNDYNDFVTKLQKDGKFEQMIQDMTIGQLVGKNSLSKNNYTWS